MMMMMIITRISKWSLKSQASSGNSEAAQLPSSTVHDRLTLRITCKLILPVASVSVSMPIFFQFCLTQCSYVLHLWDSFKRSTT
mmetsp:Transcript_109633/g.178947  ORF Transcript_109633/g.178947 Transcript_109633/m.178947 type:complete len:84 (-) Transcript_109633:35-286(-)